jgi:hypothetical protein
MPIRFTGRTSGDCGAVAGATFMGLGDLPGGKFQSDATAISADGTIMIGRSAS